MNDKLIDEVFKSNKTLEGYKKAMFNIIYSDSTFGTTAYECLKCLSNFKDITNYELDLFLFIYQNGSCGDTYTNYLRKIIRRESEEHKIERLNYINSIFKEDKITVYRGVRSKEHLSLDSIDERKTISYTLDYDVALKFAHNKKENVITKIIDKNRVLLYSNDRQEQEVFVIPQMIKVA